jgi:hypothetical protein
MATCGVAGADQVLPSPAQYCQDHRRIAGIIIVGHLAFAALFVLNLMRFGQPRSGPTLLAKQKEVAAK